MHLTTAVALCGIVVLGGAAATTLVVHPDLSGQWTLNAAQSDNPRDMLQARDSSGDESRGGRSRGGYGGRGGFGRGRGGGAGSGMSDEQRQRMRQTMQLVFEVSGGGKVTEDYLRSQDGKRLYVIVGFEGRRGRSIGFRRVYDGAASAH